MLPPQHRLRRSEDFRSVFRAGKRAGGRYVVAHVLTKSTRPTRVGFVVSKAVGNAVTRNRVKRRMRHICAEVMSEPSRPADIVFRALPRSSTATSEQMRAEMRRNLGKLGVLE